MSGALLHEDPLRVATHKTVHLQGELSCNRGELSCNRAEGNSR